MNIFDILLAYFKNNFNLYTGCSAVNMHAKLCYLIISYIFSLLLILILATKYLSTSNNVEKVFRFLGLLWIGIFSFIQQII